MVFTFNNKSLFSLVIKCCCVNGNINANILNEEYRNQVNHTKGIRGFNVIRLIMLTFTNKREYSII